MRLVKTIGKLCCCVLVVQAVLIAPAKATDSAAENESSELDHLDALPPGLKYRQLKVMHYMSDGMRPENVRIFRQAYDKQPRNAAFNPDASGVEMHIADPESIASAGIKMLAMSSSNRPAIERMIAEIEQEHGPVVQSIDDAELIEDAILVRSDILDSFERVGKRWRDQNGLSDFSLDSFQDNSYSLQDDYEMIFFDREIDRVTNEALDGYEGALLALQREVDGDIDHQVVEQGKVTYDRLSEGENEYVTSWQRVSWYFQNMILIP